MNASSDCPFCNPERLQILALPHAFALMDRYPVAPGHMLVVPQRHVPSVFDLTTEELDDLWLVVRLIKDIVPSDGFNVGFNDGIAAGQTVMHAHVHVIPRERGDMENPQGGVRGCIPHKRIYK